DFVTVMLMLASLLAPNMPLTSVSPTAFTISDGVQTLTQLTSEVGTLFEFATGADGQITEWDVTVAEINTLALIITKSNNDLRDRGQDPIGDFGSNSNTPGLWTTVGSPSVADTGSTLSLMTLTLMALGLVARRFKRAAG